MPAHEFKLQPSRQFMGFFACILLVSLGAALCLPWWWMKVVVLIGVGVYGRWIYKQYVGGNEFVIVQPCRPRTWLLKTNHHLLTATLLNDSIVTTFVSILRFRTPQRTITQIIFRDSLPVGDYRKLLLAIKWQD